MNTMKNQHAIDDRDRALVEAVVTGGDERAFLSLYDRHTPRLLGFVHRILGGLDADAEDVVQETWVRACEAMPRFRWEAAFSTWLLGIGLNVARNQLRHRARTKTSDLADAPEQSVPVPRHGDRIDLERAIGMLPEGCRMVLVLHDIEGMKHREIAQRLGITAGTSKSQLFQARKMMRAMLSTSKEIGHER